MRGLRHSWPTHDCYRNCLPTPSQRVFARHVLLYTCPSQTPGPPTAQPERLFIRSSSMRLSRISVSNTRTRTAPLATRTVQSAVLYSTICISPMVQSAAPYILITCASRHIKPSLNIDHVAITSTSLRRLRASTRRSTTTLQLRRRRPAEPMIHRGMSSVSPWRT